MGLCGRRETTRRLSASERRGAKVAGAQRNCWRLQKLNQKIRHDGTKITKKGNVKG